MLFSQLRNFDRFTIEDEPQSLFYKEGNNYDGSVNAYKIKDKHKDDILQPVTFSRGFEVNKVKA